MSQDTVYIERANGRFEAWAYSDGLRIFLKHSYNQSELIYLYETKQKCKVIIVE